MFNFLARLRRTSGSFHLRWLITMSLVVATALAFLGVPGLARTIFARSASQPGVYVDAKLGFSLRLPGGWQAKPSTAQGQPAQNQVLTVVDRRHSSVSAWMAVFKSAQAPSLFASKGTPNSRVGSFAAFAVEIQPSQQFPQSCSERVFLVGTDYIVARWCGHAAQADSAQIEGMLATYRPAPMRALPSDGAAPSGVLGATTAAHPAESCASLVADSGYSNLVTGWGVQLATPTDTSSPPKSTWTPTPGWDQYNPGAYVCSNGNPYPYEGSNPSTWYFQCTELANRFIYEQWDRPEAYLSGNAGTYMDYYNSGVVQSPTDLLPDVREVYDARWAANSAPPQPGDLLVWQDVAYDGLNPPTWKLNINGTGHVAVVTGTDANYVYVAQQNDLWQTTPDGHPWENGFAAYTLQRNSNGQGWSVDMNNQNGVKGRLLRGWLHFTENNGPNQATGAGGSDHIVSGDFNGDGYTDIATFYNYAGSGENTGLWVFPGSATGPKSPAKIWQDTAWSWNASKVVAGDFNGDGYTDVAVLYKYAGSGENTGLWIFPGSATGLQSPSKIWQDTAWSWNSSKMVAGDFNGDGYTDVAIFYNYGGENTGLWVFPGSATGLGSPSKIWQDTTWSWDNTKVVAGDFNGDFYTDIAAFYNYGGEDTGLWIFSGSSTGLRSPSKIWQDTTWSWSSSKIVAGDFNGDVYADVAVFYNYAGSGENTGLWIFPGSSTTLESPTKIWQDTAWNWNNTKVVAGDFNNDLSCDVAAFYNYAGSGEDTGLWNFPGSASSLKSPSKLWEDTTWNWNNM